MTLRALLRRILRFRQKPPSPGPPTIPTPAVPPASLSARVAMQSLADVARAGRLVETSEWTFHRTRIGSSEAWVCSRCAEVIVNVGSPGAAHLLTEHRREHRRRGDL